MTLAVKALTAWAFAAGFKEVHGLVHTDNSSSMNVLVKAGYRKLCGEYKNMNSFSKVATN